MVYGTVAVGQYHWIKPKIMYKMGNTALPRTKTEEMHRESVMELSKEVFLVGKNVVSGTI